MRVAADRARLVLVLIAATSFAACKVAPRSKTALVDDLDQIEAELRKSDERLADAGVVVAYRDAAPDRDYAAPPAEEAPATPDEPTKLEPEPGSEPPAPTAEPPPEAPVSAPDAEQDDAPALSGRSSRESVVRERDAKRRSERKRAHKAGRTRCERVCELSETTCDLQARVCDLATEHPDDVRYEDACRRAEDQCDAATRSCETCAA